MITGREPNIRKLLSPEERAKFDAEQEKALTKREKEEQRIFDDWLRPHFEAGELWVIHPQMNKASTIEPGTPDYTLLLSGGRTLLIEMKTDGGSMSPVQRHAAAALAHLDHPIYIAWGHAKAIAIVQKFLEQPVEHPKEHD